MTFHPVVGEKMKYFKTILITWNPKTRSSVAWLTKKYKARMSDTIVITTPVQEVAKGGMFTKCRKRKSPGSGAIPTVLGKG